MKSVLLLSMLAAAAVPARAASGLLDGWRNARASARLEEAPLLGEAELLAKAKQEGSVVWYAIPVPFNTRVIEAFEARYPGIKVVPVIAGGTQIVQRFKLERAKGYQSADCVSSGLTEAFPDLRRSGHLARLDNLAGWSSRPDWSRDPSGRYFYYSSFHVGWMWNTTLLKESDLPASVRELTEPKWRGRVALYDPTSAGVALPLYRWLVEERGLGLDWLKALRANEPYMAVNAAQLDEAVGTGRRWLALARDTEAFGAAKKGAPVAFKLPKEGSMLHLMPIAVNRDAPNPHAARLFVAWLLSDEAQTLLAKEGSGVPLVGGKKLADSGAWSVDVESIEPARTRAFMDSVLGALKGS